ncbi:MAG: helix-turn-helix transcriptional regulator [Bacteroidetes bacterium]|nr:helix-turn-helix transcriptional regulator [Bacteroidota bacterium]
MEQPLILEYRTLYKSLLVMRVVNHPMRQEIIKMIQEKGKITVTEIFVKLRVEQSIASQHLAALRRIDLLTTTRAGKYIYYTVVPERIKEINDFAELLLK